VVVVVVVAPLGGRDPQGSQPVARGGELTLVKHVCDEQVAADGDVVEEREVGGALVQHAVPLLVKLHEVPRTGRGAWGGGA
jgi:hypothetical protein